MVCPRNRLPAGERSTQKLLASGSFRINRCVSTNGSTGDSARSSNTRAKTTLASPASLRSTSTASVTRRRCSEGAGTCCVT
ncbi:Uncharacterised protein [Mycobacteroides abscessus subsp. abscessus]|nr:Uncharacterised protein [Mycobacteroides abscessus subsp. abscessus]